MILQDLAIFGTGIAAGTINVVVGSGTLITFPTLLAFGYPPVLANVSNNIGIIPGSLTGAYGYRGELTGQRSRLLTLGSASLLGGLLGAVLLLTLPAGAFQAIVPVLIGVALVMVVAQPRLAKWVARRQQAKAGTATAAHPVTVPSGAALSGATLSGMALSGMASPEVTPAGVTQAGSMLTRAPARERIGPVLWFLVFCTGLYGGYFGAAQGVLLIGLLGIALNDTLQRVNAAKNVLAALVNGMAAVVFILVSHVDWTAAGLIALGSVLGGMIGARVGRKLPPWGLRVLIICVGIVALVKLLA
ncbi:MAG TPA: sulfite exporter TauE/SafE family protein [Trebonia sp.]|nr:sulfite exporter TauE/SafE family protein [Trebonia sp.]